MTIQQFIEKAIEGGWQPHVTNWASVPSRKLYERSFMLDPDMWKSVVRQEVLSAKDWHKSTFRKLEEIISFMAEEKMHRMIDALAEGKTIEQYLETL